MISTTIEIIKEHITHRRQILKLAKSDMIRTYSGSVLGWLWMILKPTMTIFVFWFTFSIGLRMRDPISGFPFFLWLIAGMVPWFYMREMIVGGAKCIIKYKYLVTKMKFPVSTIPTIISLSKLAGHLFLVGIVIIIYWIFGFPPTIYLLQLPFYILCMYIFFTILSYFTAPLSAISKDFGHFVKSMMTAIFWLSGIIWNIHSITIPWLSRLLMFNPVTFIVNGFRSSFVHQEWFFEDVDRLLGFACILVVAYVLGMLVYKKFRKEIPDVL